MDGRFFLGVADNNRFSSAVVGDSYGRILTTAVSGSVNYQIWGIEQARDNLREIIEQTVGWNHRHGFQGICFTYKSGFHVEHKELLRVIDTLPDQVDVQVEDFILCSTRGIQSKGDRLLLVGGASGGVFFENDLGISYETRLDPLFWDLGMRISQKLAKADHVVANQVLERIAQSSYHCLQTVAKELDILVACGNSLALEIAYDVAHDLVRLVTNMARYFSGSEPVIGLSGTILIGSKTIEKRVRYLLTLLFPKAQIVEAPFAQAKGAYLSSLLTRKSGIEHEVITNVSHTSSTMQKKGWLCFGDCYAIHEKNGN